MPHPGQHERLEGALQPARKSTWNVEEANLVPKLFIEYAEAVWLSFYFVWAVDVEFHIRPLLLNPIIGTL